MDTDVRSLVSTVREMEQAVRDEITAAYTFHANSVRGSITVYKNKLKMCYVVQASYNINGQPHQDEYEIAALQQDSLTSIEGAIRINLAGTLINQLTLNLDPRLVK